VNRSSGAYEMYSLSFFVIRTSGSLPRRPTRMSLDTSEERAAVEEKAYIVYVRTWRSDVEKKRTHASKAGAWLAEEGEHERRVQDGCHAGVTRCALPPLGHMFE
jgi:hypothetical protein